MKYPNPCEDEFKKMSKEDPDKLIKWIKSGQLKPVDLTFALEYLKDIKTIDACKVLLKETYNTSVVVREGAIYGLYGHLSQIGVGDRILMMLMTEESKGIRGAIKELLSHIESSK